MARVKYILRDDLEARSKIVLGVRWDGVLLMIGGPIGLLGHAVEIMSDVTGWKEARRKTTIERGENIGAPAAKFKLYFRPVALNPEAAWLRFLHSLKQRWNMEPVKNFNRLVG